MPDYGECVVEVLGRILQRQHRVIEGSRGFIRHDPVNMALRLGDEFTDARFDMFRPDAVERDLKCY